MKPRRLTLFALMTLALAAAIFASFRLPIMYKAIAPPVAIILYLFVTVILFDLARTPKWLNVAILILLIAAVYLLFPTIYYVKFVDSQPIEGILIAGEQVHTGEKVFAIVPRGIYLLQYTGKYRESLIQQKNTIFNPLPVIKTITLKPGTFAYSSTKFYEPYKQKELFPSVVVRGKDIDGNPVELNGDTNTRIPFGTYTIGFDTQYFSETRRIKPETYYEQEIILNPNKNTIVLSYEEAEWVRNYVKEYLDLSARRIITEGGFPRQYHLYTKNYTLSLGDMLFVVCEMSQQEQPVYYSPKNMNYVKGGDEQNCYLPILSGRVPAKIQGMKAEQAVHNFLLDTVRTVPFEFGDLNQRKHVLDWALSYDIEYGRYVPTEDVTAATYSTCNVAPGYLTPQQCANADFAGWVSETTGTWWYNEYGYPVSSGMIGWRYILELSQKYGIPTTDYIVTKDLRLFGNKDPALVELSKKLAEEGLMEVGSQTRYHTRLDKVSELVAKEELGKSREELEQVYNVSVTGIRTPYLSLVNGDIASTESALSQTGYTYYSLYGEHRKNAVEHKPINFYGYMGYATEGHLNSALQNLPYVISLDHPWNIQFKEVETERGIVLEEAPEQPVQKLALILEAISKGVWFTTVKEIEVK